jgi:hypothetical protein
MEKQLKEKIRSVVKERFISELSKNDIHVKEIMKFYDKGTYSTKKAVSIFVSGKTNATRNQILDDLGDMGYNEAWEVMDHFKLKIESVNEESYKVAGRPVTLIKGKKSDATDWKVKFQNGKETSLSDVLALIKPFPKGVHWRYKNLESVNESDLKGYLVADVVDDIVKSIGSKFVSGQIKNAPNRNYIYLKLTDIKFGSGVVKMLKSQFGIDAKIDKTFGNIPSVSFSSKKVVSESINEDKVYIDFLNKKKGFKQDRIKFNSYEDAVKWARKNFDKFSPDMIKYESVNENTLNEGFGDSIKKIRNLAIKMASTKYDRAKSHLNLDKIASADDFDGKDTMNKATAALLQQKDLDEDLKSAINKIAVKLGTGATMMGIIHALVSMSGWIQYLDSTFTKWYYTEIQKLAEPEVMKVMQDLGRAGQAEGSMWGKFGMYAFFIFFTIAVISLVAARMTKATKNEYVDKKGVERVAAALPQTEEEPIKECKTCNSK